MIVEAAMVDGAYIEGVYELVMGKVEVDMLLTWLAYCCALCVVGWLGRRKVLMRSNPNCFMISRRAIVGNPSIPTEELRLAAMSKWPDRFSRNDACRP